MSKEQFEAIEPAIEAIADKNVVPPNIPVAIALQEAEDLYYWCLTDKSELTKAGLLWALVENLPIRIAACRYKQSMWQKDFKTLEDAQKEWAKDSPVAYDLRDELLHHFFHAYRNNPDVLSKVQKIAEGSSHADMIQDLSDLAVLGNGYPEPLKAIGFDLSLLTKAAETAGLMSELLAKSNGLRMSDNKLRITRDKAYMYMKQAVDEIRHHGQYVFWRNPERKKGYVSSYVKKYTSRATKASTKTEVTN